MGGRGKLQTYCRRRCTKCYSVNSSNTTNVRKIITEFVESLQSVATFSGSVCEREGGEQGKWLHNAMTTGAPGIFLPPVRICIYDRDTGANVFE
jgi:hypothetical protein